MIDLDSISDIFLYKKTVDFRKSINGLSIIIQEDMKMDIFAKYLFVFTNRRKNKIKILYWDRTGFALWYKRLEKGQFKWPLKIEEEVIQIDNQSLTWLLEGIDITKIKPHKEIFFEKYV